MISGINDLLNSVNWACAASLNLEVSRGASRSSLRSKSVMSPRVSLTHLLVMCSIKIGAPYKHKTIND